jgi:capsule biosynthesis phosphatase
MDKEDLKGVRIVVDVDGTLCMPRTPDCSYADVEPDREMIARLQWYRDNGVYIVLHTSRQMRTYEGNLGLISVHMLPVLLQWLRQHEVPFDEVIAGKPWCGEDGFYVDDRAIRPSEFKSHAYGDLLRLIGG